MTAGGRLRRVVAAHAEADGYGSDRMLLESLRGLQAGGTEVELFVGAGGPLLGELQAAGIPTTVVSFPVLRKALLRPLPLLLLLATTVPTILRIMGLLRRSRPDILYVNSVTLPHWSLAARLLGIPVVVHVREADPAGTGRLVTTALALPLVLVQRLLANSTHTASVVTRSLPWLARRMTVVYNGFRFPPPAAPRPRAVGDPATLVVVGRLNPRKGQDVAIDALARLVDEGRDCRLRLVGSTYPGYEWVEADLRAKAAALGLGDRVELPGFNPDQWGAYAQSDVALVPSLTEPFGNVAVEAMAMGLPVVASRVGGLREIVEDGATGLLVEPGDAAALAAAVRRLLDDPVLAARLARAGDDDVRERFSVARAESDLRAALEAEVRHG